VLGLPLFPVVTRDQHVSHGNNLARYSGGLFLEFNELPSKMTLLRTSFYTIYDDRSHRLSNNTNPIKRFASCCCCSVCNVYYCISRFTVQRIE